MQTSRRSVLKAGLASTAAVTGLTAPLTTPTTAAATPVRHDPFTLGVASGDPWPDGFVLWTRLAVDPVAENGLGGMPNRPYAVQWQVATDERFRHVVKAGVAVARPEHAHAVHVTIQGLRPSSEYYYRFRAEGYVSRTGRTLTAPARGTTPQDLNMSFVSCSQFEHGWFTAYRRLAEDRPDLVLHLGDYQYEYTKNTYVAPGGNVRDHDGPETTDLASYRQRHAQYKSDLDLQAAHAVAPWLVVWDDHELDNNWADEIPEKPEDGFLDRRAAAFQAYYENMPLRATSKPRGIDMQLYRRAHWGELATFHMLDTRQYRDDQGCGDGYKDCPAAVDPKRSITGARQEEWLLDGFRRSRARWDVLGQQVFFAQRDNNQGPLKVTSMDSWDGYVASRERITRGWVDAGVRNAVVLTGDVHAHWASDLKLDYDDPTSATVGSELVCSSISTGGDGADSPTTAHPWLTWNPHLRFQNNLRGYVNTTITRESMVADFRTVRAVKTKDAEVFTRAQFTIEDGKPGLHLTGDTPPAAARTLSATEDTVAWETARP
ncbi:alkaline phosphatase D family protein [Kribbella speibonae]|uniref:Alkaline phosphatase n=1 Tax=Kribbella speibonae TaxID=1572660 RepID=A0A4R0IUU8_9ACTN|nr:alkaline phosphatase D family protein [Kribbella speibonae]TCC25608.1 alkaline phosphatase [Kribbella speibonae]TCC37731.1 alkaline phosphatase [Kribbella speibonae]